ncbi:uncharacterized protein cubi_03052 [Cryptosporidium ubiquitum]|uniref:Uncharacterized protein n=1 Tax=Cryptosporidium ubiquitum TaxID=857276 RepID=A0A1J4ML08_9CRYT|nr:uncharacterized protein cubi_03052 [Cryptosporidium ubiquitum]OII74921.1 hypothetical protein cubi_03052 [Cryptosporidium ubiquitum]
MVYKKKEREKNLIRCSLFSLILLVILEISVFGEERILFKKYLSGLNKADQGGHLDGSELIDATTDLKFKQILIERTCGDKGTDYSKEGLKFVKNNLEEFSLNEYYKLKSLNKLPKIYSGKNEKLMLRSFREGEILGSPLRLRLRLLKDEFSIQIIEDDFGIFSDELDSNINIIYPRVMNEIRYTVLLCGGGLITMLPVIRYIKSLNSYGEYISNDPIILQAIGIYEREMTESRRRSAKIEAKYLTTLPYSDEIYTGKSIKGGGLIIGISDSIEEEKNLVTDIQDKQNLNGEYQGAVLGLNIRAKEDFFKKNRENAMNYAQGHFVYNSVFDFDSPNALFTVLNEKLSTFEKINSEFISNGRSTIPHQITRADSIKNTTINRIKSSLETLDRDLNEYTSEGSIEPGSLEPNTKMGETILPGADPLNPESIIIGKRIRPNDQISSGSIEKATIIPESKLKYSELEPIKGFPVNEKVNKVIAEILKELDNESYLDDLINLKNSKVYGEAYRRFPAYISQKKIIPISDQAYVFWESLRLSNNVMGKKHGITVSNFPEKENIPGDKILPNKIPVTGKEITKSCYRLIRYFQKSGTPFIFRIASKIQGSKDYNVDFIDPVEPENNKKYKLYAKMFCNQILPEIFVYTFHKVFELLISKREQKYFNELDEKRLELEVQQKEAEALKKIRDSVMSRVHITPYIIEKPYERYFNAWRRSFGYNGFIFYPQIKISILEKMYNIVKFGPQVIEKKKKNASPDEVKSSISKALVRIIDEYFASINTMDLFLHRSQVEEFLNKIFSNLFNISMIDLIKKMPITPEMDIKSHGSSLEIKELFVSCTDYIKAIINFNKNINKITDDLDLEGKLGKNNSKKSNSKASKRDFSVEIKFLENGYESACMFLTNLLKPNIIEYSLLMGLNEKITKKVEKIKSSFIHQSLTDSSSTIPFELGLKMFENSYMDVYKRVCEQHGILHFIPENEYQYFDSFPMFNEMSKLTRVELTSNTINFSEIEQIFLSVFESIIKSKKDGRRLELFNENIMATFIFEILNEKNVNTPSEIKSLPPFSVSHKYPWSPFFNKGLNQWCTSMINSLVEQKLLKNAKDDKVFDKNDIEPIIKSTCKEEVLLRIRNNIEYEADEILRRNFAYHLAASFVYWHYYIPLPKWIFFENWESIYSSKSTIKLSEEPEISLVTFILFKCIADLEYTRNTPNGKEMLKIRRDLSNIGGNSAPRNKANMAKLNLWSNTPIKSIDGERLSLAYFFFPNVIGRDIIAKITPEDVLAFTGPHDIFWVGADEKEFLPMCLNSIEKLKEYLSSKKLDSNEEINIWVSDDVNSRELFCRDIAGRFFYPRSFTNSDSELPKEINSKQVFSIERLKLRRSQWLAIQEAIRRRTEKEENKTEYQGGGDQQLISLNVYSSFVVDFQESDEQINPGSFMKNCIAAFDTAMLFPEGSPYKLKILNKPNETIRDICDESMKLFYSSAVPMDWDEQQSQFNPISLDDIYSVSRIALAQHNVISEQINEQNELGDYSIRSSERFNNLFSSLIRNIGVSDSTSKFMEICSEYIWECIKRKLLFLGNGYDISNSNELIENVCKKSSYRYFVSNVPIKSEEISMEINSGREISEWQRTRYKTVQWKMLEKVFDSFANRYPGGYEKAISKTFKLPKYMQLANFNNSEDIFTVEEDCKKAMSYLIRLHSCASNFVIIFGKVTEFCNYVSQAFKQRNS